MRRIWGFRRRSFDKQYMEWLDKRVGKTAANFDEWRKKLKALVGMAKAKDYDGVIADGAGGE